MKLIAKLLMLTACSISLAYADVVVVVSSKSPVSELSKDQVADLYLGKNQELGGGTAELFDLTGGIKDTFYEKATGRSLTQVKAIWSKLLFNGKGSPPKEVAGAADVKKAVAASSHAIGYLDSGAVDGSVKVVLKLN